MLVSLGLVIGGLLLLVVGGEALLRGAVGVATLLRLPPAVVGLTVVAAGTSVPELAVSVAAGLRGQPDITVGNVVGSNIFNATVIVGLCALVRPVPLAGTLLRLEYPVLVLATLAGVAAFAHGTVGRPDGVFFLAAYAGFTAYLVRLVREQVTPAEERALKREAVELAAVPARLPRWSAVGGFLGTGVLLLAVGVEVTLRGAVDLGSRLGLSERVVGLTIVAAGTGAPEVVVSLVSAARGRADVAVANVIGSNLFNLLGILGLSAVIAPLPVAAGVRASDGWWMLGVTLLLLPFMRTGQRVSRWGGRACWPCTGRTWPYCWPARTDRFRGPGELAGGGADGAAHLRERAVGVLPQCCHGSDADDDDEGQHDRVLYGRRAVLGLQEVNQTADASGHGPGLRRAVRVWVGRQRLSVPPACG